MIFVKSNNSSLTHV